MEDAPSWADLRHAYGPAADLPALLALAHEQPADGGVWDELWSRLCHQGTVYSASYAALPALAAMAAQQRPPRTVNEPLHLAAAILASSDGPEERARIRHRAATAVESLRVIAERDLLLADDDNGFVHGLQALLACEGVAPWQEHLDVLLDEEIQVDCPTCGALLSCGLSGPDFAISTDGRPAAGLGPIVPAQPDQLVDGEARAFALAARHGPPGVVEPMLNLFGQVTCPSCGTTFAISDALG